MLQSQFDPVIARTRRENTIELYAIAKLAKTTCSIMSGFIIANMEAQTRYKAYVAPQCRASTAVGLMYGGWGSKRTVSF